MVWWEWWATHGQQQKPPPGVQHQLKPEQQLDPADYQGAILWDDFNACLQNHKMHVIAGSWVVTVPWSWYRRSTSPVFLGTLLALLPDALYAHWRCNEVYQAFSAQVAAYNRSRASEQRSTLQATKPR